MSNFLDNLIVNKTGLACQIWDDLEADKLRRRLESKVEKNTLLPEEWSKIIREVEGLLKEVRRAYDENVKKNV